MTEPRRFSFGSVPVYSPQSLTKEEAIAQFHARQGLYESLLDLLREERPSHVLIIGTRGMGKTTLLQRVRFGVEDSPDLNCRCLALSFPEEQYNVNRLHHFLLNAVDALADALEQRRDQRMLARVEEYADKIGKLTPEEIEEDVPKFLAAISGELQRSLLLLVDNADRLFETIDDRGQWRLRELLSNRHDLTFFGATTQASEGLYGSDRAFFEFFKIYRLEPLALEEVRTLLIRLGEVVEDRRDEQGGAKRRVEEWLAADAARLRTLVQLTGGNPRTTVLLFHLVLDGLEGGAREYLEQLLDQCTPGYKGQVDDLPPQAQQVLDALARRWDPATASEIAEDTGLETTTVSTQMTRLVRQGLLEKVDPGDSKKAMYQVAERFFNIWYLMRASRRVRTKLRWFVEFLRVFYDSGELEQIAWERLKRFRATRRANPSEVENIFAYAMASGRDRRKFEDYLRQECADREEEWKPFVESARVEEPDGFGGRGQGNSNGTQPSTGEPDRADLKGILDMIELDPNNNENWRILSRALRGNRALVAEVESAFRRAVENNPRSASSWEEIRRILPLLGANGEKDAEATLRRVIELDPGCAFAWGVLGEWLGRLPNREAEAETALRNAIQLDPNCARAWGRLGEFLGVQPDRADEAEDALRKAVEFGPNDFWVWGRLGELLRLLPSRQKEAEAALRRAIEIDPKYAWAWGSLGELLRDLPDRKEDAEGALRKAVELDPTYAWAWGALGELLGQLPGRGQEGETALRKVIELDPKDAFAWGMLGELLRRLPDREQEAETALRTATEIDSEQAFAWASLGALLLVPGREGEAEVALRKAIEIDPEYGFAWGMLGELLIQWPNREQEAEAALRRAIELDPEDDWAWSLGDLLRNLPQREQEAEAALRRAIDLDPKNDLAWNSLGELLSEMEGREEEAEAAFRQAIALDPKNAWAWADLADFLVATPRRLDEAEAAFGRALEIEPDNAEIWSKFAFFLAFRVGHASEAEAAFRKSVELDPDTETLRNLGVLLVCEREQEAEGVQYIRRAAQPDPDDSVSPAVAASILAACVRGSEAPDDDLLSFMDEAHGLEFWDELLELCKNYAPFGKILLRLCDLVQEHDSPNTYVRLHRAVALAQLGDFPRASVALEDALVGDPLELLSWGRKALETFFAAAVKNGRAPDCLDVIEKKEWIDAWRPIYEALKSVEAGSSDHLKRVAVEIRVPAREILQRIAPDLAGLTVHAD